MRPSAPPIPLFSQTRPHEQVPVKKRSTRRPANLSAACTWPLDCDDFYARGVNSKFAQFEMDVDIHLSAPVGPRDIRSTPRLN